VTTLAEAAVLLARKGYRVLPVGPDKTPLLARGFHDATDDPEVVDLWSRGGSFYEYGADCGNGLAIVIPDRVFVVDVDPRNGGQETMLALNAAFGLLANTRTVRTRSGGWHYYYRLPDDRDLRGKLGPGVDIKKPGRGYVLVPPTAGYVYARGGAPAPAPQWLLDELTMARRDVGGFSKPKYFKVAGGTPYGLAAFKQKCEQMRDCSEGGRRATLNTCAFVLATLCAGGELDEDKALDGLLEAAMDAGLTESQAVAAMKSGWAAGLQNPRQAE
jgi:hypothetical protein